MNLTPLIAIHTSAAMAGAFTLLPGRLLGNLVLGQWLGLV